jgi:cell division protein FtsW
MLLDKLKGDKVIWLVVLLLSLFSMAAVYSSTGTLAYKYQSGNTEYYLIKHSIIILSGLFLMYITSLLPYKIYSRLAQMGLWIVIPMLLLTLLVGANINEAKRWLTLPGINMSFQTSDMAKLVLIMYLARVLSLKQDKIKELKNSFIPIIVSVSAVCGLIALADLSTAFILFSTSILVMIIGRINLLHIVAILLVGGILATSVVMFGSRRETYKSRFEAYMNPEKATEGQSFQMQQAKIAVASGGIFGNGPGNSVQRNFLPHPYSDFIYAIIIEEYGSFFGGFLILVLYLILLYRGVRIATKSPGAFGALLAAGLSFSLVIQAMIHMMVNINLLPVTGIPLPLVSMGGTSIWFTSIAFGIILSVSRNAEELEAKSTLVNQNQSADVS